MCEQPQVGPRRGAVAVISQRRQLLVIRRSQRVEAPGSYCFPGGGIEGGESAQDAVRRELWEELGVRVRPRRALWHNVTSWRVALDWWWTDLDEAAVLHPNPDEVEAVHWMTPDQMLALPELLESNRQFLHAWQGGQFQLWDPC